MIRNLSLIGFMLLAACGTAPSPDPSPSPSPTGIASTQAIATAAAAVTPLPIPQPAGNASAVAAYQRVEDRWTPIRYLCDGIAGDRVQVMTMPGADGAATLWTYAKPGFATTRAAVRLGTADSGMSHTTYEVLPARGADALGALSETSPGVYGDMEVTTLPTLSSMRIGGTETRCRWLPGARVLLVTPRRSVVVAADLEGSGYIYRSFDHDKPGRVLDEPGGGPSSTPTAEVKGGRLVSSSGGREVYEFTKAPWTYRVTASARAAAPGASVAVLRDGKPVVMETAAAYEMAAKRVL